jgi:hypothetical protein
VTQAISIIVPHHIDMSGCRTTRGKSFRTRKDKSLWK